jgi:hypothetical protein
MNSQSVQQFFIQILWVSAYCVSIHFCGCLHTAYPYISVGVCILRIHTFHRTSFNVSLDITVERKGKCTCPIPAQVLVHPATYVYRFPSRTHTAYNPTNKRWSVLGKREMSKPKISWRMTYMLLPFLKAFAICTRSLLDPRYA